MEEKNTLFLSMISTDSCMIIHYIAEKIFLSLLFTWVHCRRNIKRHTKDFFKINGKQKIKMPKKGEYVNFKNFEGKIKSPFMIYADFER